MSSNNIDKQRKLSAHLFKASCQYLDNKTTCSQLDTELEKYSDLFSQEMGNYHRKVEDLLLLKNCQIKKTKFHIPTEISSFLKPLDCSNSVKCNKSENISEAEFQDFMQLFKKNDNERHQTSCNVKRFDNKGQLSSFKDRSEYNQQGCSKDKSVKDKTGKSYPVSFKTARDELQLQNVKKNNGGGGYQQPSTSNNQGGKKKLGLRRNINSKFVSPLLSSNQDSNEDIKNEEEWPSDVDERLKNVEPKMVELIRSEIMDCGPGITWEDIAGLEFAKTAIQEAVVWPMLRPDIFTGLRRPPKGILLFGPPGTGKTLIGKCVASQSKSTFFSISASSLTSKWIGDGEKMVRALFVVARVHQPAVIFIDEIDSLLSQRSDTEHESSRRIKTEFLVQLDGATTESDERILVIGATNRPQELDEAARRRFVKRLYIPLPDYNARLQLVQKLINQERHELNLEDFETIATKSDGYSGADIRTLCSEASLGPIRSIDMSLIEKIDAAQVRPLIRDDFEKAFQRVRSSVSSNDLDQYIVWDNTYGSGSFR